MSPVNVIGKQKAVNEMTITEISANEWTNETIDNALVHISFAVARLRKGALPDVTIEPLARLARQLELHLMEHPGEATRDALKLCRDMQALADQQ